MSTPIKIPIFKPSGDRNPPPHDETVEYARGTTISKVKDKLLNATGSNSSWFNPKPHIYVEVVLHGEEEGRFLEDDDATHGEKIEDVSKLVYWTKDDIDDAVKTSSGAETAVLKVLGFGGAMVLGALSGKSSYWSNLDSHRKYLDKVGR